MASTPKPSQATSQPTGLLSPSPSPKHSPVPEVANHLVQTAPVASMSGGHGAPLSTQPRLGSMSAAQLQAGLEIAGYACVARSISCGCGSEVWGLEHLCRHAEIRHQLETIDEIALNYSRLLHQLGQNAGEVCNIMCLHCDRSGDVRNYPRHAITHVSPGMPASLIPAGCPVDFNELPFLGPRSGTPSSTLPGMYDTNRDDNWVIFSMHANRTALNDSASDNFSMDNSNILPSINHCRHNVTNLPPHDCLDLVSERHFAPYHEQDSRGRGLTGMVDLDRPRSTQL